VGDPNRMEEEHSRISYVKPRLERVDLKPEEAVIAGCKAAAASGPPTWSKCTHGGSPCSVPMS
jgi:hypothetical protein